MMFSIVRSQWDAPATLAALKMLVEAGADLGERKSWTEMSPPLGHSSVQSGSNSTVPGHISSAFLFLGEVLLKDTAGADDFASINHLSFSVHHSDAVNLARSYTVMHDAAAEGTSVIGIQLTELIIAAGVSMNFRALMLFFSGREFTTRNSATTDRLLAYGIIPSPHRYW